MAKTPDLTECLRTLRETFPGLDWQETQNPLVFRGVYRLDGSWMPYKVFCGKATPEDEDLFVVMEAVSTSPLRFRVAMKGPDPVSLVVSAVEVLFVTIQAASLFAAP